jgi:cytochrome c553
VFWTDIEPKVGACSGCHSASGTFPPMTYDNLVDQDSVQLSSMKLIAPSDPENSYLLHKISGTHQEVGGSGSQMPMGTPLSSDDIALVEAWIEQGARLE